MQDRQNARLMGMKPTGNGRRQSFAHIPMPRMTNTYMLAGNRDPKEILASVKKGLYAVNFGGGQVDITPGKFVFSAAWDNDPSSCSSSCLRLALRAAEQFPGFRAPGRCQVISARVSQGQGQRSQFSL